MPQGSNVLHDGGGIGTESGFTAEIGMLPFRKLTQTARISCAAAGDGVGAAESTGLADGCGVVDGPNTAGIMKRNDIRKNTPKVDKNMP
ncbi:MAG: hypothetical protein ACLTGG_09305 [Subdoligranulum sp.]